MIPSASSLTEGRLEIEHDHRSDREILLSIERKLGLMAITVTEVQEAVTTLTTDLEADAAAALTEFTKLEAEIAEKAPEVDLTPLKESIVALDTKAKEAATKIPTE